MNKVHDKALDFLREYIQKYREKHSDKSDLEVLRSLETHSSLGKVTVYMARINDDYSIPTRPFFAIRFKDTELLFTQERLWSVKFYNDDYLINYTKWIEDLKQAMKEGKS